MFLILLPATWVVVIDGVIVVGAIAVVRVAVMPCCCVCPGLLVALHCVVSCVVLF